ncbi:MAG TPA: hypothetical protein VG944_18650 [Fimbriimonas sp.]|nr:hypothetical protein [Fimbriimonas sp.]
MKRFAWSKLYPKPWQEEFGDEFEALLDEVRVGPKEGLDIVLGALRVRAATWPKQLAYLVGWAAVGFFDVFGNEVQWAVGVLLLTCGISTAAEPKRFVRNTLFFFSAVPICTLVSYQFRELRHDMFYQTIVALIPATIGSLVGLAIGSLRPPKNASA